MGKLKKEFGNLTLGEFKLLIGELPDIRSQMKELPGLFNSAPSEKVKEILDEGLYWLCFMNYHFKNY